MVGNKTEVVAQIAQIPNQAPTTVYTNTAPTPGMPGDASFTVEDDQALDLNVSSNDVKINLDSLKGAGEAASPRKQFYKGEAERRVTTGINPNTRVTNTYTSTKFKTSSSHSLLVEQAVTWGLVAVIAAGTLFGGWYFYNTPAGQRVVRGLLGQAPVAVNTPPVQHQQQAQQQAQQPPPQQQQLPPDQTPQETTSASTSQYTVLLVSEPIGARIYINGEDTGAYTPNRRSLESFKDYVVTLKKEGYLNYEGTIRAMQNGSTFTMSMQPAQKAAYISISVANGGLNTVIYVNGIRLGEKPPIQKYAIPAGTPVRINAYDPFSKLSAEQIVKVEANQKKSVDLILGVDQRKPSGQ
jgi:hypothetical protein